MKILTFLLAICMAATIVQAQPASESIWWLNTNKVNTYSPPNNINQPYTFLESDTVRSLGNGLTDVVYHSASNKYYCIASVGGAVTDNAGTLLVFDPATQRFTKRLDFGGARGSNPAALTWGIDENLYGITTAGGANNSGVLFKFTIATQTYTKLMDLPKPAAGWNISFGRTDRGYLRQASTGTFYIVNPYTEL
ncbi:MAG: choice-of-anchor tandem repeat GloVer-containing protein, partial [Flammeovirgaceae bacterium]